MINADNWLSICVATFNRSELLTELYDSIISQNDIGIELVIVNDGSTDGTEELVQYWIEGSRIKIKYVYQDNFGRGTALRKALLSAEGEYSIIMDDDDYFLDGTFEKIKQSLLSIEKKNNFNKELAGVCYLCLSENGNVLGDEFPNQDYISDFFKMGFIENICGDKKEIVRTQILKENIFPYFENEKRVVTSTLWNRIAYEYDCLCFNYPVAVKRYLKGGMSDSLLRLKAESPNYQIENCIVAINYPRIFSLRITLIYSAILWKYWFFGGIRSLSRINIG